MPMLGALGSLIGGAAGVPKAVSDNKAAQRQLEELLRHNRAMEGHGLYLAHTNMERDYISVRTNVNKEKTSKKH